jgi:hypothetical protein
VKSITPLLVIVVLATIALVGCGQNTPNNSSGVKSTNLKMDDASSIPGGFTNMPATNGLPNTTTDMPAGKDQKLIALATFPSD